MKTDTIRRKHNIEPKVQRHCIATLLQKTFHRDNIGIQYSLKVQTKDRATQEHDKQISREREIKRCSEER